MLFIKKFQSVKCLKKINFYSAEVPSPPGKPEPSEITDNSVTLHWKEPKSDGDLPIIEYILEYHEREEDS